MLRKKLYEVGELPPLGEVPEKMYAWTLRSDRLGESGGRTFQKSVVTVKLAGGADLTGSAVSKINPVRN